jgi:hypothetical protein
LVFTKEYHIFIKIKNYMASTSNHYGDVANWIEKVINSCETPLQEIAARKLIRLFEKRIDVEAPELSFTYSRKLNDKLNTIKYTRLN